VSDGSENEIAAAIRALAEQVDHLGNAVQSAANTVADAVRRQGESQSVRSQGISSGGTFT
jgi:hypothetical protein